MKTSTTRDSKSTLGALTISPIESLCIEAGEPPLSLRRHKLVYQYYSKLISCFQNPSYNCIMGIRYKNIKQKPSNLLI